VRHVAARCQRAGWIDYQQILAGELPWVWLIRTVLIAFGFTDYKAAPPALNRIRHTHAVNAVGLMVQGKQETWIIECMILAGLCDLPQKCEETRYIPEGILHLTEGDIAVEVELTQKKPDELARKMHTLIHARNEQAFSYAYEAIWYSTSDKRMKKALETAKAEQSPWSNRHMGDRSEIVGIELLVL
jgi:hypothetical protein